MIDALTTVILQPDPASGRQYSVTYVYFDGVCLFSAASRKLIATFERRFSTNFLPWEQDRPRLFQSIYRVLHHVSYQGKVTIEQGLLDELDRSPLVGAGQNR